MATKVIRLQDSNDNILIPVTNASYVQMKVENETKSVQDVIIENELITARALTDLNDTKQELLTFDSTPTSNSTNPVTSGGIKTALDVKADKTELPLVVHMDAELTCDTSIADIYTAYSTGRVVQMKLDILFTIFSLALSTSSEAKFFATAENSSVTISGTNENGSDVWTINDFNAQEELTFDSTPTTDSQKPVTSGGIKEYVDDAIGALLSNTHIPADLKLGSVAGKMYREDVMGTGNFTVKGNAGIIPTLVAGTYTVAIYAKSATSDYKFRFNFGSVSYDLTSTNGIINDVRTITVPSGTFSGSVISPSSGIASNTILSVNMYNYQIPISTVGKAAVTNNYGDLDGKPSIPTVNNGTLTIQKNGTNVATFTANQSGNSTANITTYIPMVTVNGGTVSQELAPNTLYKIGSASSYCSSLSFTLGTGIAGAANYYHSIVTTAANMTFTKPSSVKIGGNREMPTFGAGDIFEFNILENILHFEHTTA